MASARAAAMAALGQRCQRLPGQGWRGWERGRCEVQQQGSRGEGSGEGTCKSDGEGDGGGCEGSLERGVGQEDSAATGFGTGPATAPCGPSGAARLGSPRSSRRNSCARTLAVTWGLLQNYLFKRCPISHTHRQGTSNAGQPPKPGDNSTHFGALCAHLLMRCRLPCTEHCSGRACDRKPVRRQTHGQRH